MTKFIKAFQEGFPLTYNFEHIVSLNFVLSDRS